MTGRGYGSLFERLVANTHEPEWSGACWTWKAKRDRWGYGRLNTHYKGEPRKTLMAHVAMAGVFGIRAQSGQQIDHLCRNPACINPDHLEVVSVAENMRRRSETKV